jgi:Na+/phosphate symporter
MFASRKVFQSYACLVSRIFNFVPFFAVLSILLVFAGCQLSPAASSSAAQLQTDPHKAGQVVTSLSHLAPFLFFVLLAGGAFAVVTQSKYAAVIPVTAAAGLGLILFIEAWAQYIQWAVAGLIVAVIVWRSGVYQNERDKLNALVIKAGTDVKSWLQLKQ